MLAPLELAAQPVEVHANGAVSVGVQRATQPSFQADPLGEARDDSIERFFTEVRPTIVLQSMFRRRVQWSLGYQFAGQLAAENGVLAYSNQANASLGVQPTRRLTFGLETQLAQGTQAQLVSLSAADTAQPSVRAPGNQSRLTTTTAQALTFELAPTTLLQQTARFTANAPEAALDQSSSDLMGTLALEKASRRTIGAVEVRSRIARLRPIQSQIAPYASVMNTALIRGSRDLSARWNAQGSLGIEQVYTDHFSKPLALLPTVSAVLNFWTRNTNLAAEVGRATMPNLEIGTISIANRAVLRGLVMLDEDKGRAVRFSVGAIHNEPIGELDALAAGIFDVVQADVGVTTSVHRKLLLFARYGASHQFAGEVMMLPSTTMHVLLVGVAAQYSSTGKPRRPLPAPGRRVDNVDGVQPDGPSPDDADTPVKQ